MARNKLEIANIALTKVGSRAIISFIEEDSNEAVAVNAVWDRILDEVLSEHPWAMAQKRVALAPVVPDDVSRNIEGRIFTPVSITAATKAKPVVITAADHGLENRERIKIVGVSGMTQLNNNFYRIANKTVDTFELINEDTEADIDGTAYGTYTSGGQIQLANEDNPIPISISGATQANPVVITTSIAHGLATNDWIKIIGVAGMTNINDTFFIVTVLTTTTFSLKDTAGTAVNGTAYSAYTFGGIILIADDMPVTDEQSAIVVYYAPSDIIKPIKKSDRKAYVKIERDRLISDATDLSIIYTFRNKDVTQYSSKFVQALATRLAAEIAFTLTNSVAKAKELIALYETDVLPSAVSVDSSQGTPDEISQEEWLDAMNQGNWPATTGETWHAY